MEHVSIEIGQCIDLWDVPDVLTEEEFNNKIATFKDQTAVRYYKRAKIFPKIILIEVNI